MRGEYKTLLSSARHAYSCGDANALDESKQRWRTTNSPFFFDYERSTLELHEQLERADSFFDQTKPPCLELLAS